MTTKSKRSNRRRGKPRRRFKRSFISEHFKTLYGALFTDVSLPDQLALPLIKDEVKAKQVKKWYSIWRTASFKRFVSRMPIFANLVYGIDKTEALGAIRKHILWYEDLVRDKGPVFAVKFLKRTRDACLRFAADHSFETIEGVKLNEYGLPLGVAHIIKFLISKRVEDRRFAIQVLDIIKLCEVPGDEPPIDSIVNPVEGPIEVRNNFIGETFTKYGKPYLDAGSTNNLISCFRSELQRMFPQAKLSQRLERLTELSDIHMSVRKGPNGPALGTIIEDFHGINNSGLIKPITEIAKQTNNIDLLVALDEMSKEAKEKPLDDGFRESCIDSRLAIKYEPWCKTRYFAICDWFSQSALKGLHKWIFGWLEKQPGDGTMSQDRVAEIVRGWTASHMPQAENPNLRVYSLDLSKATDRLPATLQREILQHMFGKAFADNWYTICTKRDFSTPGGEKVRFAVGQPLGVYSSWAMLALTHHVICRLAYRLAYNTSVVGTTPYVVIGDDVAMVGDQFAVQYSLLMKTVLQVGISPIKGFTPETSLGSNPLLHSTHSCSAEIAKRVYVDGQEISVVSPETLKSAMEYPADFPNLIHQLTNRGCLPLASTPVTPIALASFGYSPDVACTFATFPLRPAISRETVKALLENNPNLLSFVPWFQSDIPISDSELETMFRWSVRSSLQSMLSKFKAQFNNFIEVIRKPRQYGDRMYHFLSLEYISRLLINRAMLYMLDLVVQTDVLNFQGPGLKLDEIASALNTMIDFEAALLGKPSGKRENLHRMRSRVITKLQPLVLSTVQKARSYFGILLIDSGEQTEFVTGMLVDVDQQDLETKSLLTQDASILAHEASMIKFKGLVERRTLDVTASA